VAQLRDVLAQPREQLLNAINPVLLFLLLEDGLRDEALDGTLHHLFVVFESTLFHDHVQRDEQHVILGLEREFHLTDLDKELTYHQILPRLVSLDDVLCFFVKPGEKDIFPENQTLWVEIVHQLMELAPLFSLQYVEDYLILHDGFNDLLL
jgi:hypothetical protein